MQESSHPVIPTLPLLEVRNLFLRRRTFLAESRVWLRELTFTIGAGEVVAFCGESGSGVSLLAAVLFRVPRLPASTPGGEVIFEGKDLLRVNRRTMREFRRKKIAMIGRQPGAQLNPEATVRQHLRETVRLTERNASFGTEESWLPLFYEVGIVEPHKILDAECGRLKPLTAGRLLLMTGLLSGARLLVCDEPAAGMDDLAARDFYDSLRSVCRERGLGILLMSGHLREMETVADRAYVMFEGAILESGVPGDLIASPRFEYTRILAEGSPSIESRKARLPVPDSESMEKARASLE